DQVFKYGHLCGFTKDFFKWIHCYHLRGGCSQLVILISNINLLFTVINLSAYWLVRRFIQNLLNIWITPLHFALLCIFLVALFFLIFEKCLIPKKIYTV